MRRLYVASGAQMNLYFGHGRAVVWPDPQVRPVVDRDFPGHRLAEIGELPYSVTTLRIFSGSAARCGDGSLLATGVGRAQGPQPVQEWFQLWA